MESHHTTLCSSICGRLVPIRSCRSDNHSHPRYGGNGHNKSRIILITENTEKRYSMRTIENVETIGISPDEIRIISKDEAPVTFNRNMKISVTDAERVVADVHAEVVLQLKESVHCDIYGYEILCGSYVGRKY